MADANYKLIEEKNDSMWFEGSPVILCAMKLELNTSNSKLYTSAKFMNIQPDNLRNLSLEIICYNENREPIDRIKGVVFSGLDVERHTDFGYNRRIPVENLNTRSVEYIVVSVTNVFNQQWENEGLKPFNEKIEQKNIYEVQGDYNKQFLEICTRSGIDGTILVFEPEFKKSHYSFSITRLYKSSTVVEFLISSPLRAISNSSSTMAIMLRAIRDDHSSKSRNAVVAVISFGLVSSNRSANFSIKSFNSITFHFCLFLISFDPNITLKITLSRPSGKVISSMGSALLTFKWKL